MTATQSDADLSGQVAVVTGAGSGMGAAIARGFARRGARVGLIARSADTIGAIADEITTEGGVALAAPADVADEASFASALDAIVSGLGTPTVLVTAAAARPAAARTEDLAVSDLRALLDVDLIGTFITCQQVGRLMLAARYGRIVNLTSFHVIATYPMRTAYVAAKAAVDGMTRSLAVEWGGRGVTVNAIAPGPIRTPRTQFFLDADPANEAGMIGRTPSGRLGDVDDVVALAAFLASPCARHVNGQAVTIDGGWTANAWWGALPFA